MITKLRGDREGPLFFSLQGGKTKNFFKLIVFYHQMAQTYRILSLTIFAARFII